MKKIAIMTDSNSGISQEEAKERGIYVLPMPFFIDGEMFYEDINLTQEQFYEKLESNVDIKTSQPTPGEVTAFWDKILEENDEIVYIPMSSGLSGACETATMLAADYDGKVQVVNNQRISVTMISAVEDAQNMVKAGMDAVKIKEVLEKEKLESSIYITVDTLKYLKKGGRVTAAAAAIGTVLNIKPVLQIQGGKLDAFAKSRGIKSAKKIMLEAIKKDKEGRFAEYDKKGLLVYGLAYTGDKEAALLWKQEFEEYFPGSNPIMYPLSLSVACHIGDGAVACTVTKKVEV